MMVFPVEIPISLAELATVSGSGFINVDGVQSFTVKDPTTRTVKFGGCSGYINSNSLGFAQLA